MKLLRTGTMSKTSSVELLEDWIRKATKWKRQRIPIEFALEQAELQKQAFRLAIESERHQKIQDNAFNREEDQAQLEDIKARYGHFVNAEKATLPDRVFAELDKLVVRLNTLKSRYAEQRKFHSKTKKRNSNGSKKAI